MGESKRKGSNSPATAVNRAKRQRLDVGPAIERSSSSGLSSLDPESEEDVPLAVQSDAAPSNAPNEDGGKTLAAVPNRLIPPAMTDTSTDMSSPEPQTPPVSSGKRPATSQRGQGMARTVVPGVTNAPASPRTASSRTDNLPTEPHFQVKQEELDSNQVTHLAAGVSIDAEDLAMQTAFSRERPAIAEEDAGIIRFATVTGETPSPATNIILTGLKNIFQKQLPKMPREYIARLVFDRNHWSMAIVKRGYQVVGGITYRPFQQRGFAEIVFCAITGTEQVRGYGSHLMNHLKDFVREAHPGIEHFLTYADNYAVGYFKKQGFTKEINMDRSLWAAYIKDYEGGTLMHCAMLPRIRYLEAKQVLIIQREAILKKIRQVSKSHIVHSGRSVFKDGITSVDPSQVPGLRDLNWNPAMDELTRRPQRGPHYMVMQKLLTDMQGHASAWPFLRPVNKEEVADYYDVIKEPMDLETMEFKLDNNQYEDLPTFMRDAQLIFDNCRAYNAESSNYVKNANKLEKYLKDRKAQLA